MKKRVFPKEIIVAVGSNMPMDIYCIYPNERDRYEETAVYLLKKECKRTITESVIGKESGK